MDACVVFLDQRMTPTTLKDTYRVEERTAHDPFGIFRPVGAVCGPFEGGLCEDVSKLGCGSFEVETRRGDL